MQTASPSLPRVLNTDLPVTLPPGIILPPLHERMMGWVGRVWFRETSIPLYHEADFQPLWRSHKRQFMERGFTIRKDDGKWSIQQWLAGSPGAYTLTEKGADLLLAASAPRQPLLNLPAVSPAPLVLTPLPNGLEDKLYEYQRDPARQLFRALTNGKHEWGYPGAWDCSGLGTGKTFQALAAALATGLEVGVICPKAVIGTPPRYGPGSGTGWTGAFAHFGQVPKFIMNYEGLRTGKREWVKKTGNSARPFEWTLDPQDTMLIWDEAHMLKNASANRSMAFAAIRQGFPCLFLSGTMADRPTNLGATGVAVGLHDGTRASYEQFLAGHGCYQVGSTWEFNRSKAAVPLTRIHRRVFPQRGARIRVEDLGDRFPETQILCEGVETAETAKISQAFEAAADTIRKKRDQGAAEADLQNASSIAYMEAWHASERAKMPAMLAMVEREQDEGRSVVLFVNFTDVREKLMAELKTRCAVFGGQPQHMRDAAISDFQADKSRVIVVITAAGGVGISLHDVRGEYPRTAIINPTNNAVNLGQALGRVHRAGGKSRSRQIVIFAAGTIEESIINSTRAKLNRIDSLNDGDLTPEDKF